MKILTKAQMKSLMKKFPVKIGVKIRINHIQE